MSTDFAAARSQALDYLQAGVMPELVLDVLDAIDWAWNHAEARVNPASRLRPLKLAMSRRAVSAGKPVRAKAAKSAAKPAVRMSMSEILAALAAKQITPARAELLLAGRA
jgi:hypothetical protein